jgi:nucleotide-binding universal stress UspA family protein
MVMQQQIIVPLDGSRLAEQALPHAVALARTTGSGLTLVQVVPMTPVTTPIVWGVPVLSIPPAYHEAILEGAHGYLRSVAQWLGSEGLAPQSAVLEGEAAEAIIRYTEQHPDAAMIVMSTRGRSGLTRWVFGSVAEKVLEAAPVPLALIRPLEVPADEAGGEPVAREQPNLSGLPAIPGYRTVLVPLDGSAQAEAALEHASALAIASGASLLLVSVLPLTHTLDLPLPPTMAPAGEPNDDAAPQLLPREPSVAKAYQELYEREKLAIVGYLASVASHIGHSGKAEIPVRTRILEGDDGNEILRAAREGGADLIVMSTRGQSGLAHIWPGSVAMKVVRDAGLPVLLVPAQEPAPGPN